MGKHESGLVHFQRIALPIGPNVPVKDSVHFYSGVSSHNMTGLDVCQGNLIMKPTVNAIIIIEDMCSNPYHNYGVRRIMKTLDQPGGN